MDSSSQEQETLFLLTVRFCFIFLQLSRRTAFSHRVLLLHACHFEALSATIAITETLQRCEIQSPFAFRICDDRFANRTAEPASLLGRGLYALQLQPWLEAFGPEQIKVLFLEEVVQVRREGFRCRSLFGAVVLLRVSLRSSRSRSLGAAVFRWWFLFMMRTSKRLSLI